MTATKSRSLYSHDAASASESEFATPPTGSTQSNTPVATLRSTPQPTTEAPQPTTPPPVSSGQTVEEQRQGEAEFAAITMAALEDAGFDPSLIAGRGKAATPEPADTSTPQGTDTPQEHQSPQAVTEHTEEEDTRSSRSRFRDFLPGGSRSRSRRTGSLFGRSKGSDSASIHTVTDAGPGADSVPPLPEHKPVETPPRKMSAVLNKWLRRSESEERKSEAEGRASVETPRSTPPASIYQGNEGRRRDRSADYSDASPRTEDSAGESKKEKKERMEKGKREKKEAEKEKQKPTPENVSPESAKSRWGGLFGRFGKSPARPAPAMAAVAQQALAAHAKITEEPGTETTDMTKPLPPARSFTERWGSRPSTSSGEPPRSLARAETFGPSLYGASPDSKTAGEHSRSFDPLPATVEARMAEFAGQEGEVTEGVRLRGGELRREVVEALEAAPGKKRQGIPVPRGGLRRRSTEFDLAGSPARSFEERKVDMPGSITEERLSWLGQNPEQQAGIRREDARTPDQIPLPPVDTTAEEEELKEPVESKIPVPSMARKKSLARKKATVGLAEAAASSESIDQLTTEEQSASRNISEVKTESRLPVVKRTGSLKVKSI